MVKKAGTDLNENNNKPMIKLKKVLWKSLFLAVIAGGIYVLAVKPELRQKGGDFLGSLWGEKVDYQAQINRLNMQITDLNAQINKVVQAQQNVDLSYVDEKISNIEKLNRTIIDSKADVATILGLITRMDKAEEKLDTMNKVADDSALILTATMLVKDSAERGGNFEYEIEVLEELTKGTPKFKEPVATMAKYAATGIYTADKLKQQLEDIYNKMLKEQKAAFEKTWKDRLNSKLGELVQIKRVNENAPKFKGDSMLEAVKTALDGDLKSAMKELEKPENAEKLKITALAEWLKNVEANYEFNAAVNRISAASLAIMKVKFLKKTN